MSRTNPVFQVLVPSGNQAPLAAGSRVTALAPGQIGVFNFHTGLSIDANSTLLEGSEVFLAVGVGSGGTLTDIRQSAGQMIQARNMKHYTAKEANPSQPKIIEVTGFGAKCETDYGIKVDFKSAKIYGIQGWAGYTRTYTYTTGCCTQEDCQSCPEGDPIELAVGLAANINKDNTGLITAQLIDGAGGAVITNPQAWSAAAVGGISTLGTITGGSSYTNGTYNNVALTGGAGTGATANIVVSGGAVTSVTLVNRGQNYVAGNTLSAAAADIGGTGTGFSVPVTVVKVNTTLSLRLTINPFVATPSGNVNQEYYNSREVNATVSLVSGFECNGTVTVTQQMKYEEGSGIDLKQQEYMAGGWNGNPGPYRLSPSLGMEVSGYTYFINEATKYHQLILGYDQESVSGWNEYFNNLETRIAIPVGQETTLTGLVAILDKIFGNKIGPLANDVAAFDSTPVATSALAVNANGINLSGA